MADLLSKLSTIAKKTGKGLLISVLPLWFLAKVSGVFEERSTEEFNGKVKDEKFIAGDGFFTNDRYTALVKTSDGREITVNSYGVNALDNDVKYNRESDIKIEEIFLKRPYFNFSKGFYFQKDHIRYEIME